MSPWRPGYSNTTTKLEARLPHERMKTRRSAHALTFPNAYKSPSITKAVQLVSSRQLTTFSDFRAPGPEDFISVVKYVQFLRDYCTEFKLWPHIRLQTRVLKVTRRQGGGHAITYKGHDSETQEKWQCDAIAVCSGLHVEPNRPQFKGLDKVPLVIHSSEFKARKQFDVDKTVMVLGAGETGADMAYLAVTSPTRRVVLCARDGFHSGPQVFGLLILDSGDHC